MPAGETVAPGRRPAHYVPGFGLLPEREVVGVALVGLSVEAAGAFERVFEVAAGEHSVVVVGVIFLDVEVHASVAFVGVAGVQDLLYGLDLLDYVAGGAGLDGGRRHVQQAHGLVVAQGVGLHDLHGFELFEPGLAGDLVLPFVGVVLQMAHVGDVAHVAHLVAEVAQQLEEHVVGHSGARVSEMGVAVDGGPADIHAHVAGMDGHEELLAVRKRICQSEISHIGKLRLRIY